LQESLRYQSLRDSLTGLYNRRYLEASLSRELARCARNKQSLAVLMLDIDHFKSFNDKYGHQAGDIVLAQFSSMLTSLMRAEDVVCRYGGEEFTVLLLDTDAHAARKRAEEVCEATRALTLEHRRQALSSITVSIGIAMHPTDGEDPNRLMRLADEALYRAKHEGRNRYCFAGSAPTVFAKLGHDTSNVPHLKAIR
jgi:diguanylate cyclase (GGDEF)-like protein